MAAQIRIARLSDAGPACEVVRRSIVECCHQDHHNDDRILSKWLGNKTPETLAGWFASAGNYALVAGVEADILGVGLLTQAGRIGLCYVTPELRFAGTGKALLGTMEAKAREWGLPFVSLDSTVTAKDFYLRQGYLAGDMRPAKSGIRAISLWKYLDNSLSGPASEPRTEGRPCLCALAGRDGERNLQYNI